MDVNRWPLHFVYWRKRGERATHTELTSTPKDWGRLRRLSVHGTVIAPRITIHPGKDLIGKGNKP